MWFNTNYAGPLYSPELALGLKMMGPCMGMMTAKCVYSLWSHFEEPLHPWQVVLDCC